MTADVLSRSCVFDILFKYILRIASYEISIYKLRHVLKIHLRAGSSCLLSVPHARIAIPVTLNLHSNGINIIAHTLYRDLNENIQKSQRTAKK